MAIKRNSKIESSFSMASMTDIVFLLLIFMLIATTMINPNALRLTLPRSDSAVKDRPLVTLSVTPDMRYFLNGEQVEFEAIESSLRAMVGGEESPVMSLHSDETVPIGEVVRLMNIAQRNGYKLILATRPE